MTVLLLGCVAQGLTTVQRLLREALAGFRSTNQHDWAFNCQLRLTLTVAQTGDAVAAERELCTLDAAIRDHRAPDTLRPLQPEIMLARAWGEAARGIDR